MGYQIAHTQKSKYLKSNCLKFGNNNISFKLKLIVLSVFIANLFQTGRSENINQVSVIDLFTYTLAIPAHHISLAHLHLPLNPDFTFNSSSPIIPTAEYEAKSGFYVPQHWGIVIVNILLSGTLLFVFLYHFGLYLVFRAEKAILGFCILLLYLWISNLFLAPDILGVVFPAASQDLLSKLKYLIICLLPLVHILYLLLLYKNKALNYTLLNIPAAISLCGALLVLFAPLWLIYKVDNVFRIYIIMASSVILYFVWDAYKRNEKGGSLVLIGHIILYVAVIGYMVIAARSEFVSAIIFTTGNIAFILFQSYALSFRHQQGISGLSNAGDKVQSLDKNLEQVLIERSEDLMIEKSLLEEMNRRLQEQKEDMLTQSEMLDDLNQRIEMEMKRSDTLLLNILPKNIADELKLHGKAPSHYFPAVTVLFVDFVGFSEIVERANARELVEELHYYFANFDDVISKYNLEKIKTIGDAYMCAGGLKSEASEEDAFSAIYAALEITEFMKSYKEERVSLGEFYFDCRIGIHTGPVVAGVVGKSKFAFDIWGQTVNIAKEAEAASEPGRITITESTYNQVKEKFECTPRGLVIIKHKRQIPMYFVNPT